MRPGGARPSFGVGRGRHRLPQALREVAAEADPLDADHGHGVLEMVDHAVDRPSLRADRDGVEHQPEDPTGRGERAKLVVVEIPGRVEDAPAAAVRAEHRRVAHPLEHLGEDAARGVGEVEDHAERDEPVDELAAEAREAPAVLGGAVRERVPAIPGEPRHPHAERVEDVGGPGLDAEALDALEREHEADALAGLDRVEVGRGRSPGRCGLRSPASACWNAATRDSASRSEPSGWTTTST